MVPTFLLTALLPAAEAPEAFIVLSEFQVWADAAGPEVFRALNARYLARGKSHVFDLYPRYDSFVWEYPRTKRWIDEAVALGAFNVFCIGDDTRTAQGHLFRSEGVNPIYEDFLFRTIAYAHRKGLMAAVEPVRMPDERDVEHFRSWLRTWLGPQVPRESRADIIKLSIEWFDAYEYNPNLAGEVEAFFEACREVHPRALIYVDSIGGAWKSPGPFHRWLGRRFPETILSHYLDTEQVEAFRMIGARNMMVQINPSETEDTAGQFFIYHDKTVAFLQDAVRERVRYLSLGGVNFGYSRYNYDLFLDVIRPHLALARDPEALRASIRPDAIVAPATREDVRAWLLEQKRKTAEERRDPPIPRNPAGRPACFGEAREGLTIRRLAAIADGRIARRFRGAYTDPRASAPVRAVFGLDFGAVRRIRKVRVVPCLAPREAIYVARDFELEFRQGGAWHPIPGGSMRANTSPELLIVFPPREADALRLTIASEADDGDGNYRACCQELAAR